MFETHINDELKKLELENLSRELFEIETKHNHIYYQSKLIVDFASNDYLGLSQNPNIKKKLIKAIKRYGAGGRSSPLVCAYTKAHQNLANEIAQYLNKSSVLIFSSAYSANIGTISALTSIKSSSLQKIIFQDKLNHASLLDGAKLTPSPMIRFKHLDYTHLAKRLKQYQANNKLCLIISDHIFSMDGDKADIEQLIFYKKKYKALLMIDDAHGFAMNHQVEQKQLKEIDVYSSSFAKALGGNGAFIATNSQIGKLLINKARSFIYSTAINPALTCSSLASLKLIQSNPKIKNQLDKNITLFKNYAKKYNLELLNSNTPIQPILIRDNSLCVKINQFLLANGYAIGAIRYPTVAKNTERLRISIHANQTENQIKTLCQFIGQAIKKFQ